MPLSDLYRRKRKTHLGVLDLASSPDRAWSSTFLHLALDTKAAAERYGGATDVDRSKDRRRSSLPSLRQRQRRYLGLMVRVLLFVGVGYVSTGSRSPMFGSFQRLRKSAASVAATTTTDDDPDATTTDGGPTIVFSRRAFIGSPKNYDGRHRSLVTPTETLRLTEPILPDYNNLGVTNVTEFLRVISNDDDAILHQERIKLFDAIDDDVISENYEHSEDLSYPRECVRNNWAWTPKPVCNTYHEFSIDFHAKSTVQQAYKISYLSHGWYRDTWLLDPRRPELLDEREFVMKTLRAHDFDYKSMRMVEKEALIMERLSASNLIVDIYGHCGTSIMAEAMPGEIKPTIVPATIVPAPEDGDIESYDLGHMHALQETDVHPMNNLTANEKLDLALLMAESLAVLHGAGIAHGDVDPKQWLKAADGSIKLNDFNNGQLLEWSHEHEIYCDYWSIFEGGTYKAPEEYKGSYNNEGTDVWAMGHGIYGLLTGRKPYYQTLSQSTVREMVMEGQKPFIDKRYRSRSLIEARLVETMEPCWAFHAADRPSIFEIVKHLRETKQLL
jgi:hypothetical protein